MDRKKTVNYIVFGKGNNFYSYLDRIIDEIPVSFFSDNDKYQYKRLKDTYNLRWINPEHIRDLESPKVIIMVDKRENIEQIERQLEKEGIEYCHVLDVLEAKQHFPQNITWLSKENECKIVRFIDINVSHTNLCNFKCEYCFVWRKKDFAGGTETSLHSSKEIRRALSRSRLGGRCFINFCARGETLLSNDIVEVIRELLEEGHYVSIVTNGTIRKKILEILQFPSELQKRMFFKMSFHYHELKKRNLMSTFWKNVEDVKNSECSYTLEITPHDALVEDIQEIKDLFQQHEAGAMPHISYARDSKKQGLDALTDYSEKEYQSIWGQFDSKMFSLKSDWYGKKITNNCYAGSWSYRVDLYTGSIQNCYGNESIGNIFDENMNAFPVRTICKECKMPYCFNSHAFLAWGVVPEIQCYSYLDMRDRVNEKKEHWVKDKMRKAMATKLYNENFQYIDRWSDYEKLYNRSQRPAIILFNSPDYRNLGDHAIALGERKFFEDHFKGYDVIEVSCSQYAIESSRVKSCVRENDIIAITGGGNLGSLYLYLQDMIIDVVQSFCKNKVIIMPQSMYFENTILGEYERNRTKKAIEEHGNVTVCLREMKSITRAREMLPGSVSVMFVPDMAFYLSAPDNKKIREGVILCLRDDKEQRNLDKQAIEILVRRKFNRVSYISNRVNYNVYLDMREIEVFKRLEEISMSELVITDCLHTMIFCAITATPCIAFDNSYGKVSALYNSMGNLPFVRMCESINEMKEMLLNMHQFDEEAGNTSMEDKKTLFIKLADAIKGSLDEKKSIIAR